MQIPKIIQRTIHQDTYNSIKDEFGFEDFIAKLFAARIKDPAKIKILSQPKLKNLDSPFLMTDMQKSVQRLALALKNKEIIGIETDHDCDGQTSHAIIMQALNNFFTHPKEKIRSYIGHRLKEGYGLSELLAKRILSDAQRPSLIITADNGSTDEPRIKLLKENGIDVIVTDHHTIPLEGIPKSAYAVLNPTREDCTFPDPYIAGCMVAWLFMAATKNHLQQINQLKNTNIDMRNILDFVALGTVADCVSMANSSNNRIVTSYGMQQISKLKRPCWQAFKSQFNKEISSEFLGFNIAPLLNSDGRLGDALSSVDFLLSDSIAKSSSIVHFLVTQNQKRKLIQKSITDKATNSAKVLLQNQEKKSLCIYLQDGHAGIHGISASRLKDHFGLPIILFSPVADNDDILTGSARSIDKLHIKEVLDQININSPDIILRYGGHKGAAGLSIYKKHFDKFQLLFEAEVDKKLSLDDIGPVIYTDGYLDVDLLNLSTVNKIKTLEPFGREFEYPIFEATATISSKRMVGKNLEHAQLQLKFSNGKIIKGIWFFATTHIASKIYNINESDKVKLVYKLTEEFFMGKHNIAIHIEHMEKMDE